MFLIPGSLGVGGILGWSSFEETYIYTRNTQRRNTISHILTARRERQRERETRERIVDGYGRFGEKAPTNILGTGSVDSERKLDFSIPFQGTLRVCFFSLLISLYILLVQTIR